MGKKGRPFQIPPELEEYWNHQEPKGDKWAAKAISHAAQRRSETGTANSRPKRKWHKRLPSLNTLLAVLALLWDYLVSVYGEARKAANRRVNRASARLDALVNALYTRVMNIVNRVVRAFNQAIAFVNRLRLSVIAKIKAAATLTRDTTVRFASWAAPELEELSQGASRDLNVAEEVAQGFAENTIETSGEALMRVEGAIERLPIDRINQKGVLRTKEDRTFVVIDLSGFPPEVLRTLVYQLHSLGTEEAYKLTYEVSISGTTMDAHLEYVREQVAKNGHKWEEFSPRATLPLKVLYMWYLDLCEKIRGQHKTIKPLLTIKEDALEKLLFKLRGDQETQAILDYRKMSSEELAMFFLGVFQNLSRDNPKPYQEYQVRKTDGEGTWAAIVPEEPHFFDWGARYTTQALWSEEEGEETELRKTWYTSFTLYLPEGLSTELQAGEGTLKELLFPIITHDGRKLFLSQTIRPAPKGGRAEERFRKIARQRMLRKTGADSLDSGDLEEALAKHNDDYDQARLAVLDEPRGRYYSGVTTNLEIIRKKLRRPFLTSPITMVLETDSKEDLEVFQDTLEEALRNENIWYEAPQWWEEHETNFHHILPVISDWETDEGELVTIPQWDDALTADLFYESLPVPPTALVFGRLKKDGKPLGTELAIIAGQGAHSSGKSFLGKILATFLRLFDPWRRVIVIDNTGAAELAGADKKTFVDKSKQKGWVDIAHAHGGDVLYAIEYDTPEEWIAALLAWEQSGSRFLVIYPDRSKQSRQKDIAMLNWLLGALRNFHRADLFGEREIQQAVVIDDALAWNADVEGADGLQSRMKLLTQDVFNQCISSGALMYLSAQAAEAMAKSDSASHAVTTGTIIAWVNFVTSGHGAVPRAIGMEAHTAEGAALIQRTAAGLERIAPTSIGVPENPGECIITVRNVREAAAEILIPSDAVKTPEGLTFKQLHSRKKA
jgi:hypothetical protein